MKPDLAELRGQIEGDIRISIWNAAKWQGSPDEVAQSLIRKAMEDPCMERALAATEAGMGARWRPIEEATHSEDGVLVCDASKPHPAVGVARLIGGTWRGYDHSFGVECIYPTPTHFMPLPSPPQEGRDATYDECADAIRESGRE